jgi:hypothetical protein
MGDEEVRTVDITPHPDFSMAWRMVEGMQEFGVKFVDDEGDDLHVLEVMKPLMMVLRKYGPSYIAALKEEENRV